MSEVAECKCNATKITTYLPHSAQWTWSASLHCCEQNIAWSHPWHFMWPLASHSDNLAKHWMQWDLEYSEYKTVANGLSTIRSSPKTNENWAQYASRRRQCAFSYLTPPWHECTWIDLLVGHKIPTLLGWRLDRDLGTHLRVGWTDLSQCSNYLADTLCMWTRHRHYLTGGLALRVVFSWHRCNGQVF